eukprot:CAMPEP_0117742840 /NCGR_PEP_ID=MMETSP0947-20121206/5774_1 /TAXON_ID=44440 /ORGANISM="Chattonella subsalsa, Strain CCMP2191" /LENGTH=413 /DNA_ID=CAMNT_0005559417 /DNA_START=315 /DNA_END=1553 /DNA_ORIENTATION=+
MGSFSSRQYYIGCDDDAFTERRLSWLPCSSVTHDGRRVDPSELHPPYDEKMLDKGRIVGRGGFGEVRLGRCSSNGKYYAVKSIKKRLIWEKQCAPNIATEAAVLGQVSHPFVIHLFGVYQDIERVCLVLQFCVGGELFSLLAKHPKGRFPDQNAKFYAAEIAHALQYLHSQRIIYRDLKPENCLLDESGHIVLTDFGLAHQFSDTNKGKRKMLQVANSEASSAWSMDIDIDDSVVGACGTAMYVAPEMVRGLRDHAHGFPVDWWALGVVLYEMLEGKPPFGDTHDVPKFQVFNNILQKNVKCSRKVHKDARDLIGRLLNKNQYDRAKWSDVKDHNWFAEIEWEALYLRKIKPPWIPQVNSQGDCRYFLTWDEKPDSARSFVMDKEKEVYCKIKIDPELVIHKKSRNTVAVQKW